MSFSSQRGYGEGSGSLDIDQERRASRTLREMGVALRKQMQQLKSSFKAMVSLSLVVMIFSGALQMWWHAVLSNVLSMHTTLTRSYQLMFPPLIG